MLGEESEVNPNKYSVKLNFRPHIVEGYPPEKRCPMIKCRKDGKDCAYTKDIMEVGYDVIGVVKNNV